MMQRILLLIVMMIIVFHADGQKRITTFLNESYQNTTRENAMYFNVAYILDDSSQVGPSMTYFISANKHAEGIYKDNKREGIFNYYYENGNKLKSENYTAGVLNGKFIKWYSDGSKREEGIYESGKYNIENFWDSTKIQQLEKGTGTYYSQYSDDQIKETGRFIEFKKDGKWIGYHENRKHYYSETYDVGNLINGVSYDTLGKQYKYNEIHGRSAVEFFYKFFVQKMRYPVAAKRRNIQGMVLVEFDLDIDGNVNDEKIIKGIGGGCDEEVLRIIKLLRKNGIAAITLRGQPIKQRMVLPIAFELN